MKNILITGATSGIGEETARYLANQAEYSLLLIGRNVRKLETLRQELGENVDCFPYDLRDIDHIGEIFQYCKERNFTVDGLAYCAGICGAQPVRSLDWQYSLEQMKVNCFAFVEMAKYIIQRKFGSDKASLVAISSLSSLTCYHGMASYSMSKAALNAACKVIAKETVRRKIRVNAILPANVQTPMNEGVPEENILNEQPLGYIQPEEIAEMAAYLLSDQARHITGETIVISGGMKF